MSAIMPRTCEQCDTPLSEDELNAGVSLCDACMNDVDFEEEEDEE